jgi:hypothetical protein
LSVGLTTTPHKYVVAKHPGKDGGWPWSKEQADIVVDIRKWSDGGHVLKMAKEMAKASVNQYGEQN